MVLGQRCWVEVDESAFRRNVEQIKRAYAPDQTLMIAVKSDAYGHGAGRLAGVALDSGAEALAVLDVETGVALREMYPGIPMLCWLLSPQSDMSAAIGASLTLGISHLWQLVAVSEAAPPTPAVVHLKIDTGLHRNGALPGDWPTLVKEAARMEREGVIRVEGIWSHLADTSPAEDRISLERFHEAVAIAEGAGLRPSILHVAASAAAADLPEARLDMVRVGLIAYGVSPFDDRPIENFGLAPVMSMRARVVDVDVSNGTCQIACGYTDGLFPLLPGTGRASLGGADLAILEIGPDRSVLEIGEQAISREDVATLWGPAERGAPRVEDWASWADTIGDEIIAGIAAHVPRVYTTDEPSRS